MSNYFIDPKKPAFVLAPMEGVIDAPMRAVFAEAGGFDFAVSEFVRVSRNVIAGRVISRRIPELRGVKFGDCSLPVQIQLLGSDAELLANTAIEACSVGATAVDLNFGCPSPTVLRHGGGAALLREPVQIEKIIGKVRKALPAIIPVSAKVRLGWERPEELFDIASAVYAGGASWIVIHARTRKELYQPGVHWKVVGAVREKLKIPIVANGDIFSENDFSLCRSLTGCQHFMIGRGALLDPFLARNLALSIGVGVPALPAWALSAKYPLLPALRRFIEISEPFAQNSGYLPCRIKQWLSMIRVIRPDCIPRRIVTAIGRSRTSAEIFALFEDQFSNP